jgi:hypothetical protein
MGMQRMVPWLTHGAERAQPSAEPIYDVALDSFRYGCFEHLAQWFPEIVGKAPGEGPVASDPDLLRESR